jgi:hypothetical protein
MKSLISKVKDSLHGTMFKDHKSLVAAAKRWLRNAGPKFYHAGLQALASWWEKIVQN